MNLSRVIDEFALLLPEASKSYFALPVGQFSRSKLKGSFAESVRCETDMEEDLRNEEDLVNDDTNSWRSFQTAMGLYVQLASTFPG